MLFAPTVAPWQLQSPFDCSLYRQVIGCQAGQGGGVDLGVQEGVQGDGVNPVYTEQWAQGREGADSGQFPQVFLDGFNGVASGPPFVKVPHDNQPFPDASVSMVDPVNQPLDLAAPLAAG